MELDRKTCYRALRTRDSRFDGRFFTAVTSTGIYCRPICPATTPKQENCIFMASAAAAREAGFRPCLRCRPETAPGTPAWRGTSATVGRALRLIDEGALDTGSVDDLAGRLGMGERQLRRLFHQHVGATPVAVAQTRRVHFAKRLIDDTDMAAAEIALASGFASIRRFNDAVSKTYGRPPMALRRRRSEGTGEPATAAHAINLAYRPPLPWKMITSYLAARAIPGVESVTRDVYSRTLQINGAVGTVRVSQADHGHRLVAHIHLTDTAVLIRVVARLRQIFDLDSEPRHLADHFKDDPIIGPRFRALPGLRIPGAWDGFELGVRAILGQQISVAAASTLAGRLAQAHGQPLANPGGGPSLLFPSSRVLATADLTGLGIMPRRAETIRAFAQAAADGGLDLGDAAADPEATRDRLRRIPGIGDWTAEYIAMRALRLPDAFPASDLGLRKAVSGNGKIETAANLSRRAEAWRPWRAYAAMALWTAT